MAGMKFDDPLTGGGLPAAVHAHIARPGKIVCIGRNYREHARELGNDVPTEPLFFLKPSTSVINDGDPIMLPPQSQRVEFEGEIGIVIGAPLTKANEDDAVKAIRGIVAVNDVTARDLQKNDSQWTRAKGLGSFCPIGPMATSYPGLSGLIVITRVNGAERQRAPA